MTCSASLIASGSLEFDPKVLERFTVLSKYHAAFCCCIIVIVYIFTLFHFDFFASSYKGVALNTFWNCFINGCFKCRFKSQDAPSLSRSRKETRKHLILNHEKFKWLTLMMKLWLNQGLLKYLEYLDGILYLMYLGTIIEKTYRINQYPKKRHLEIKMEFPSLQN